VKKQYIISIDIGTSSCKTALFDIQGNILSIASCEHKTFFGKDGAVDQNPAKWWEGSIRTIRSVIDKAGILTDQVAVIGVDSHSSSVIPVSQMGKVLHPAMIWTDRRAGKEREWIDQMVGQELLIEINGNQNDESNAAPKILWIKNHYPSIYQDTYKFLNAAGYLVFQLTGLFSCNISEGGLTQLFDVQKGIWSEELVRACGLDMEKLPQIYPCHCVVGGITKEAAALTGLVPGTPVVAGSIDSVACGLGCGITRKGDAFITGGTVTALGVCSDKPVKNGAVHVYHHIVPGTWCNMAGVDYGGGNFRWFRDEFMSDCNPAAVYQEMDGMAESIAAGAEKLMFLPTSVGQRCPQWDGNMKGVFLGISPNHGRAHFIRSVMEGNAFAVRELTELMEEVGAKADRIMIAGGIARSDIWMKIFSDILGTPLFQARDKEAAVMGNMLTAAYGVGIIDDFDKIKEYGEFYQVSFRQENHEKYNQLYSVYQELYPALKTIFAKLADIQI